MFYHGFDNYMRHAFPEDELRPLSCAPLTRDRDHPEHIELNDVLGNYSLTLIDSLSTLAILSSSASSGPRAWRHFQDGVRDLVKLYGDGSNGPAGQGERSRGFDMNSKVQVFETVIRGLGNEHSGRSGLACMVLTIRILQGVCSVPICLRWRSSRFEVTLRPKRSYLLRGPGIKVISRRIGMVYHGRMDSNTMASF